MFKRMILIGVILGLASCATVKLNTDPTALVQGVGYTAAFLFAQNNPDRIGEIEQAVQRAVTMAESPTVDMAALIADIRGYAADLQIKSPRDARVIYPVIYQIQLLMDVSVQMPEQSAKVKALLVGISDGIRDAKGGK